MVYDPRKKLRRKEIDLLKNAADIRQIQYLGVRLVDEQCEYEPEKIGKYAIEKGYASRLGYLAETASEAAKNMGLIQRLDRVGKLVDLLYTNRNEEYVFLAASKNIGYDNDVLKRLAEKRSTHNLNKKWKVYSAIHAPDIEEYIELYLIDLRQGNYVKVCEPNISKGQLEKNFKEFIEIVYSS